MDFFEGIDWDALREQKAELAKVMFQKRRKGVTHSSEQLDGILHLIDGLQDYAVEVLRFPKGKIFGPEYDTD